MKIYDLVKQLLTDYPIFRNSDKELTWEMFRKDGKVRVNFQGEQFITKKDFMDFDVELESVRRTRQKIQEKFPNLGPTSTVQVYRDAIEAQKSTHVYREELNLKEGN